jgi:PII-like signaling protein
MKNLIYSLGALAVTLLLIYVNDAKNLEGVILYFVIYTQLKVNSLEGK